MHALSTTIVAQVGGSSGPDLTRYFIVCGVLLGAIMLLAWGFKKLIAGNLSARAARRNLQILDVLPMGGKQKLAVVRCYDRTFRVGLGDKEISPISERDGVIAMEKEAAGDTERGAFQRALDLVARAMPDRKTRVKSPQPTQEGMGELVG